MATTTKRILLDIPEQIETERLVMQIPNVGDGVVVNAAVVESIAEVGAWMPWANPTPTVDDTEIWCRQSRAKFFLREEAQYSLRLRDDGAVVGACGFWYKDPQLAKFEVGYWVRTPYARRGLVTEAATAITRFLFDRMSAERVEIRCDDLNAASARVAVKCGYALEGIFRHDSTNCNGALRDTRVYSRIRST